MSSRLGQSIQRFNGTMSSGHATPESQQGLQGEGGVGGGTAPPASSTTNNGGTTTTVNTTTSSTVTPTGSITSTVASVIGAHHHHPYKGHRGHKRGHSYGGAISPPHQSGFHHSQLEARPSPPKHCSPWKYHTQLGFLPLAKGSPESALWMSANGRHGGGGVVVSQRTGQCCSFRTTSSAPTQLEPGGGTPSTFPRSRVINRPLSPPDAELRKKSIDKGMKKGKGKKFKDHDHHHHHDMSLDSMECGLGPCTLPECFQQLANIKFFVFILALLVTLQQGVASGYVNSVITTIESRFEIPSRFVGMVASSYEMGNVITVMFVSYLGAKRHIPRWIAVGVLVMVVGCIVFTLPEFLTPAYQPPPQLSMTSHNGSSASSWDHSLMRADMRNGICRSANPQSSKFISEDGSTTLVGDNHSLHHPHHNDSTSHYPAVTKQELLLSYGCTVDVVDEDGKVTKKAADQSYGHPLILFMLAQLLLGCGGSPLFTLGITYVDDHVPAESSSIYIGIVYAMAAFGPVLGFLVGAWMLAIPSGAHSPDGQPIGVWWGGYLIAGVLLFVACIPFLTFPRISKLKSKEESEEKDVEDTSIAELPPQMHQQDSLEEEPEDDEEDGNIVRSEDAPPEEYGQSLKTLPQSIWRLITNPTYVVTCLGGCMELNIVSGFVVFLPKYLETQFELGKSEASLFVGGIAIPGACLGIFAGGYLVKRLQLKPSGAAKFVLTTNVLCLLGYVLFFFLGCSNPNLAGGTVPYPGDTSLDHSGYLNLTSSCNSECSCDNSMDPQMVCHEGVTYYSPCHAGCSVNMTQCSCAGGASVTPGRCVDSPAPCKTLVPFMIVLFFMTGTVAVTQMPLLMIVLRSVTPEERSFALGMQFVIFRIFGYIPSPIIFGNVIDSACLLWKVKRCSTLLPAVSGRCLLYDIQDFRYKYVGVLSGLKLLALALFLYDYFQLKRIEEEEEKAEKALNNEGKGDSFKPHSGSIISLDKLFQESDTASAMTTLTTATTATTGPHHQFPLPLTSESACLNTASVPLQHLEDGFRRGSNALPIIISSPPNTPTLEQYANHHHLD
ncbi:Solute carrier organic anion transporter family member 1C1 [Orchesella cincta]|uniref:Solute carrier organic anion transporter family member 1C1 n=1 Tax=Orchesella cincta TaxID=48709 RepID=A0A1D2N2B0_ORCCI|nr:Solute carrier organic anion transporter family member 1C1 [Orchesella cincta]